MASRRISEEAENINIQKPCVLHLSMQLFKHIDKDHSGYLSVFELKDALALGNLHLSMQTIQALMRLFKQGDRLEIQLDREEFERLHNFMKEIVEVFNLFDSEGNGKLTKTAANAALENINYQLSSNALDALYQSCDPDQNNELTLNEWISMNVILRGCQAVFRAFSNGGNTITLNQDQLIFAVAHIV